MRRLCPPRSLRQIEIYRSAVLTINKMALGQTYSPEGRNPSKESRRKLQFQIRKTEIRSIHVDGRLAAQGRGRRGRRATRVNLLRLKRLCVLMRYNPSLAVAVA